MIEAVIKNLSTENMPGLDEFSAEFYKIFKEELIQMLLKPVYETEKEEYFQIHFTKPVVM